MNHHHFRWLAALLLASNLTVAAPGAVLAGQPNNNDWQNFAAPTTTPIKHVVVIFQENFSFDHYFATYPNAANPANEPGFYPREGLLFTTPSVNGLTPALLNNNPNSANPFENPSMGTSTTRRA